MREISRFASILPWIPKGSRVRNLQKAILHLSTHTPPATQRVLDPTTPAPSTSKKRRPTLPVVGLMALVVGATAACGNGAAPVAAAPTVVVTQVVTPPEVQTVTETVQATVTAAAPKATAAAAGSDGTVAKSPSKVTVPNGVGLNYQDAQDAWRAAGLHVAPAHDATGANRVPVLDANWVVLSQDLEPGSKVAADSFITATIKKYTDG